MRIPLRIWKEALRVEWRRHRWVKHAVASESDNGLIAQIRRAAERTSFPSKVKRMALHLIARELPKCGGCGRKILPRASKTERRETWLGPMTIGMHQFCWVKQKMGVLWCWKNGLA